MDTDGTVTIEGAEGTPGADWCLTIATSDSDGGEYIFTEHQRGADPPAHVDNLEFQHSKIHTVEVREAEDVYEETRSNGGEGEGKGGEHGGEASEHVGGRVGQEDGDEVMEHVPPGPEKEGSLIRESSNPDHRSNGQSSQHGGSGDPHKHFCTPSPPGRNPTPVQPSQGGSTTRSPATRFARWIVQRAHKGRKEDGNTGGKETDRPLPPEDGDVSSAVGHGPKSKEQLPATRGRSNTVGRTKTSSVKGFKPMRTVQVSMTCPLPTKLHFHPSEREEEFDAPTFGTTVLGNSHGFDPKG